MSDTERIISELRAELENARIMSDVHAEQRDAAVRQASSVLFRMRDCLAAVSKLENRLLQGPLSAEANAAFSDFREAMRKFL